MLTARLNSALWLVSHQLINMSTNWPVGRARTHTHSEKLQKSATLDEIVRVIMLLSWTEKKNGFKMQTDDLPFTHWPPWVPSEKWRCQFGWMYVLVRLEVSNPFCSAQAAADVTYILGRCSVTDRKFGRSSNKLINGGMEFITLSMEMTSTIKSSSSVSYNVINMTLSLNVQLSRWCRMVHVKNALWTLRGQCCWTQG